MRAFATEHRTPSVGWALVEDERPGRFHPERAAALGVPKGPLFGALQRGEPVTLADGRVVRPEEVVEPRRRGRTVVVTGDTRPCAGTVEAARGADLLVHDCTFGDAEAARAAETMHSTAREAARVAREAGVARLVLTHLSTRYDREWQPLVDQARAEWAGPLDGGERRHGRRGAAAGRSGPRALGGLERSARAAHRRRRPRPLRSRTSSACGARDAVARRRAAGLLGAGTGSASAREATRALPAASPARCWRPTSCARSGRRSPGCRGGSRASGSSPARATWTRSRLLGAYLLFYWPISYLQARGILSELPRRPRAVLDLGSGPAPVAFAALDAGAAEVVAADRSARALAAARSLAAAAGEPISTREWNPARGAPLAELAGARRFDLVTMGHVVNELFPGPDADARRAGLLEQALELVAPGGSLVVFEPALRDTSRALLRVRDLLVARGYAVRAPCLFRGPCPALLRETDWCHAERPIEPPPARRPARQGGRPAQGGGEDELPRARAEGRGVGGAAGGARLPDRLRAARRRRGASATWAAAPRGGWGSRSRRSTSTEANRRFGELLRGDVVEIAGAEPRGDGLALGEGSTVKVIAPAGRPVPPGEPPAGG